DHQPVSIYVSLDTRRDYLYVDDGAALVCDFVDRAVLEPPGSPPIVKILASGQSVTIATLLGEFRRLTRQGLRVVVAPSAAARAQAHDLRFCSRQWPELDRRTMTPLPVAIAATLADIQRRVQRGTLLPVGSAGT
ncbi:MAG: SDR family NAD-dependent epimerase/dehydratase, partial [Micrococcales bacterium]|nr:SDR family NAD-dependent epimerase/dehydratase [Micrococcales bacterium]